MSRFLGIIPARGGSKGIPGKNLAPVAGHSLLAWSVASAKASQALDSFLVSTDDEKIAEAALALGADVPFMRPAELASDIAGTADVVRHAIAFVEAERGTRIDYAVVLQPTSPFRTGADIDQAISLMLEHEDADSLITCHEARSAHPAIMYSRDGDTMHLMFDRPEWQGRRQDFDQVYIRNGSIYITRRDLLFHRGLMRGTEPLGLVLPEHCGINIDDPEDLEYAAWTAERMRLSPS